MWNLTITNRRPSGYVPKRIAPQNLFEFEAPSPEKLDHLSRPLPTRRRVKRLPTPATPSGLSDFESIATPPATPSSAATAPAATSQLPPAMLSASMPQRPQTTLERRRCYVYPDGTKTHRLPPNPTTKLLAQPKKW